MQPLRCTFPEEEPVDTEPVKPSKNVTLNVIGAPLAMVPCPWGGRSQCGVNMGMPKPWDTVCTAWRSTAVRAGGFGGG